MYGKIRKQFSSNWTPIFNKLVAWRVDRCDKWFVGLVLSAWFNDDVWTNNICLSLNMKATICVYNIDVDMYVRYVWTKIFNPMFSTTRRIWQHSVDNSDMLRPANWKTTHTRNNLDVRQASKLLGSQQGLLRFGWVCGICLGYCTISPIIGFLITYVYKTSTRSHTMHADFTIIQC